MYKLKPVKPQRGETVKMGIVISIGMGKGGVGKTTTCAIVANLLSDLDYKILCVDFDSQGNFTQMLTKKSLFDFEDRTIFEALKTKNIIPYIHEITENLHLVAADDYLAYLSKYIWREYEGNPMTILAETLEPVKQNYDFILMDLPPNLGDHTLNGLAASDYTIPVFQPEPFCFDGLFRYDETVQIIQEDVNPKLKILGILTSMMDSIAVIDEAIFQKAQRQYKDLLFETVIKRRVRLKEYSFMGIQKESAKDRVTLKPYIDLVKELLARVQT